MLSSTAGSMLRALAWADPWSRRADKLPRYGTNVPAEASYSEIDTISVSPAGSRLPSGLNPAPSQVRVSELVGGEDNMIRILLSVAMAVVVAASAHAQQPAAASRLDDIIKRGTLRVGMTGDYLPFTYLDK